MEYCKLMGLFSVKLLVFDNGERYPILLFSDGAPVYMPTLYITSMVRSSNPASKTIETHLRAIMHLYSWSLLENINIDGRLAECNTLTLNEMDSLVKYCKIQYPDLLNELSSSQKSKPIRRPKVVSLQKARARKTYDYTPVKPDTAATRIRYIREYLDWLMLVSYARSNRESQTFSDFEVARDQMYKGLTARLPGKIGRNDEFAREGLSPKDAQYLKQVLDPNHRENPWVDKSLAYRNQVVFAILISTGIRRGELLGIKIADLNFQEKTLLIRRRADDPEDVRIDQPNAKTRDRKLSLITPVMDMIYDYIINHRTQIPRASHTPFLFVTHKRGPHVGQPLSTSGYSKIFVDLRKRVPNLPDELTGHVLRHTWNEDFSSQIDELRASGEQISDEEEKQMRNYSMGWSKHSESAATYTKRGVREKAKEFSLSQQRKSIKDMTNDK